MVVEKREALKSWTILLAILAFGFSLLGTFIVRSGLLTSVHAFANDPERGMFILAILAFFVGGSLTLYAARAKVLAANGVFGTVSRESALILNNILLAVSCFVVFIGTIWPLVAEMVWGRTLSVGPPFFDAAFSPFMVAIALVLPLGSLLAWKRGTLTRAKKPLWGFALLAISMGALAYALQSGRSALGPIGVALGVWVVGGALLDLWLRGGRENLAGRWRRIKRLPRADWGKSVAHIGVGVTTFGVAAITAWQIEDIRVADLGDSYDVGAYTFTLVDVKQAEGPNYVTTMAEVDVIRGNRDVATLYPEKRFYPVAQMPTTEAAIRNGFLRDIYVVIGEAQANGGYAMRVYIKPFANWIWGGCMLMAFGALISLTDRRLRVGAGASKPKPVKAVPAE
jgi:cytochrome c-type biogenesis protein CcmF